MEEENHKSSEGNTGKVPEKKIKRRDALRSLATVPVLGVFAYSVWKYA